MGKKRETIQALGATIRVEGRTYEVLSPEDVQNFRRPRCIAIARMADNAVITARIADSAVIKVENAKLYAKLVKRNRDRSA